MAAVHLRDVEHITGIPYKTLTRWAQYGNWPHRKDADGRKFYDWNTVTKHVSARQKREAKVAA